MIRVASVSDVPAGEARHFVIDGEDIAIVNTGAYFYAINDICSHEHYHLSLGEVDVDAGTIECPKHGSQFDLETGQPYSLPAVLPVQTYGVKVVGDDIMVDVLDRATGNVAAAGV